MSTTTPPVFKLAPGIQSYAWGKRGKSSLAAQLAERCIPGFETDEGKTYAELWMGTHPTLPSHTPSSTPLTTHLASNNHLIGGDKIRAAFPDTEHGSLPFLFKVLSIGTALSIQAHPDKALAERLFEERPDVYKDNNHKPEMAIALTPFLAFLNFLPLPTILLHLLTVPELSLIIPSSLIADLADSLALPTTLPVDPSLFQPTISPPNQRQKDILKTIFDAFMSCPQDKVTEVIGKLMLRYEKGQVVESEKGLVDLTVMLNEQYENDVGVLCVFVLNVVELKRGQAAFLGANMPHAYISGDIIECMATSDNVVRAGLTPKLRDVPTLVSMLTYEAGPGSKQLLEPVAWARGSGRGSKLYDPPIAEFSVVSVELETEETERHGGVEGPSIVVVTEGKGRVEWGGKGEKDREEFEKGDVLFIGAGVEVVWSKLGEGRVEAYRAFVEA